MIYLDNAATTLQKPEGVKKAMIDAFENCASAGRGGYEGAMTAADYIYTARERAAAFFGAPNAEQVVFTNNATHSLNIAIKGVAAANGNCIISGYEHNSVIRPIAALKRKRLKCRIARGRLFDCDDIVRSFIAAFDRYTRFAVCTHMSNVFGYILPIKEIDDICYKKGIPLIVDASQSAGSVSIKLSELRATVCICAPGHKGLYGPQGTGVLVCRNGESLSSFIEGGTGSASAEMLQPSFMPDRFESGTMNAPGIAGLSEGIAYVEERGVENILKHERNLIRYIAKELVKIKDAKVYVAKDESVQGGVLSFTIDAMSPESIAYSLSKAEIAVRSGLQCSPIAHHTVGTTDGTVRVSVSDFTTFEDVGKFVEAVYRISGKDV